MRTTWCSEQAVRLGLGLDQKHPAMTSGHQAVATLVHIDLDRPLGSAGWQQLASRSCPGANARQSENTVRR